jgi:glycosyltransferase involved in cell wall biosynthesis
LSLNNNIPAISVIIPTYNPGLANLQQTLNGLKNQDLPADQWECIIVDNASVNNTLQLIDASWHPNFRIVKENRQGLTFARLKGYEESKANLMILVDDDNILDPDYLSIALSLFNKHPKLGVAGGKSIGIFETQPEDWFQQFYSLVAVRPYEQPQTITGNLLNGYPIVAPIGAGMILSRKCFEQYYNYIKANKSIVKDRTGNSLTSGGDNEINIIALKNGFEVGYFPELSLQHLINNGRLAVPYLKRLNYSSNSSWVKVLYAHDLCPWKPISPLGVIPRNIKAFFSYKPWKSPANAIKYHGACGLFKGLSELTGA